MDLDTELYDGRQGLEMCALYLVGILIYENGFEPLVTESYQPLLSKNIPKVFGCKEIYLNLKSVIVYLLKENIFL